MNRIELYVDKANKLTLDFYYNLNDDYPMTQFKGKNCYSIISNLCDSSIIQMKENEKIEEVTLYFKNCILNISEHEQTLKKRGTGPINKSILEYCKEEAKKTFKPKKVKRQNKHTGKIIIAGALLLSLLGFVAKGNELTEKELTNNDTPTIETTFTYQTEIPPETIYVLEPQEENKEVSSSDIKIDNNESDTIAVCIDFEDTSNTSKAKRTRDYYGELLKKYSKMYGVDPEIITAIATQERGIHSEKKDPGGATGLMQLQNSVWIGNKITAYNYETKKYETLNVEEKMLSDIFYNIRIGCMYFQNCMDYMDNNVIAAIQCYNYGIGNMKQVLSQYSLESGKTRTEILSDVSDCGWLECRSVIPKKVGDSKYVEHVLRWLGPNINVNNLSISNESASKMK